MQFSSSIKQKLSEPHNIKLALTLLQQEPTPSRHSLAKDFLLLVVILIFEYA